MNFGLDRFHVLFHKWWLRLTWLEWTNQRRAFFEVEREQCVRSALPNDIDQTTNRAVTFHNQGGTSGNRFDSFFPEFHGGNRLAESVRGSAREAHESTEFSFTLLRLFH